MRHHPAYPATSATPALPLHRRGPFWLRRPWLIARDLLTSRDRPDLERLSAIADPEAFVWAILPHAARTFSACIALLPARSALPAAVAYLYCRMLDTYEDLVPDRREREASLAAFADRFSDTASESLQPAPPIASADDRDDRDRAHLLLVRRAALVDRVFLSLDAPTREVVADLVRDMAEGMRWSSETFARNGGVLRTEDELAQYCGHVLGNPVVFSVRLLRLHYGVHTALTPAERQDAMRVGEMVQLANITRDIEKDLRRGIAYDPALLPHLGEDPGANPTIAALCRDVRARLVTLALRRARSYARVIDSIHIPRVSVARASAVLMLLFTERYFRGCHRRMRLPVWDGPDSMAILLSRAAVATVSKRSADREIARVERAFLRASGVWHSAA